MALSQNGYQVLDEDTSGPLPRLRAWVVPGASRNLPLRDGSAGFLLVHMATWFDRHIERLVVGFDDWGWSPRKIAGSTEWSNHASGTAIDLNSDMHPQGEPPRKSFTELQILRIHRRLELYNDCLKWGGDYRSTPDSMHFEIDQNLPAVVQRAQELGKSGTIGPQILQANPGARKVIYD